jgi:sporulation integral membrane protein YtvI
MKWQPLLDRIVDNNYLATKSIHGDSSPFKVAWLGMGAMEMLNFFIYLLYMSLNVWRNERMLGFYRKYWRTAFDIGLIVLTVFLVMWAFSFIYSIASPILFAIVVFFIIEPLARFLHKRGIKKSIASGISVLLFIAVILGALLASGALFYQQVTNLYEWMRSHQNAVQHQVLANSAYLKQHLPPEVFAKLQTYTGDIAKQGVKIGEWLLGKIISNLSSATSFALNFLISVILAYFLSTEIDFWKRTAKSHTPKTFKKAFHFLRIHVLKGILSYVKAQLKLITITFLVVLSGLLLLGVKNAFTVAVLSAVFDVLPLLGVSSLFIPWIVYLFIVGNSALAIKLSILTLLVLLLRQILEPKITGDSLGVSAFTTLSFMVISLSIFGVAGLILSPMLILLIKALLDQGYFKKWIHMPADEYEEA